MFDVDNLSTQISNHSNLGFMRQSELVKLRIFLYFLFLNHSKMEQNQVKMIWDTVYVWSKKVWTYKSGHFVTMRDPSKHTFVKLNAYGFNVAVLEQMKKYRDDSMVIVKQKWTKICLIAPVSEILKDWEYLVFNWEKQVFYPKSQFGIAI